MLLNLPKTQVIWGYQRNPKPAPRFARLTVTSYDEEAQAEYIPDGDRLRVRKPVAGTLEVQLFDKVPGQPVIDLEQMSLALSLPSVVNRCVAAGVYWEAGAVQDVPSYVANGIIPEPRAIMAARFHFMSETTERTSNIAKVLINGATDEKELIFETRSDMDGKS